MILRIMDGRYPPPGASGSQSFMINPANGDPIPTTSIFARHDDEKETPSLRSTLVQILRELDGRKTNAKRLWDEASRRGARTDRKPETAAVHGAIANLKAKGVIRSTGRGRWKVVEKQE